MKDNFKPLNNCAEQYECQNRGFGCNGCSRNTQNQKETIDLEEHNKKLKEARDRISFTQRIIYS